MLAGARILLTGATGRLGRHLAEELLRAAPSSRSSSVQARGSGSDLGPRAALPGAVRTKQVTALCGDVIEAGLGLDAREQARLHASVDVVIHAAATTSFSTPLDAARSVNVDATRNVLEFAEGRRGSEGSRTSARRSSPGSGPAESWNRTSSTTAGSRTGTSSRSTRRSCSSGAIAS